MLATVEVNLSREETVSGALTVLKKSKIHYTIVLEESYVHVAATVTVALENCTRNRETRDLKLELIANRNAWVRQSFEECFSSRSNVTDDSEKRIVTRSR